ncbi:MAG: type II toxin-antitoxin system Phd/YefM family antitoxin [Eubacterium sp.]|nr:type II toxin-antitoxin system Phd/YefM family antitoxin [Eubacterium sp.]
MPSIKPISNLRNYTDVLKEVDSRKRVYLTRNGYGAYTIMSIEEADELDRLRAMFHLVSDLKAAEEEADREGWIEADEFEKEMEIYD